jgi:hypothetical protein
LASRAYAFESEAGPLLNSREWIELARGGLAGAELLRRQNYPAKQRGQN